MEKLLKLFFEYLEDEKKASSNTMQSYKRDLKQFRQYLEYKGVHYNKIDEEFINGYIKDPEEEGKKSGRGASYDNSRRQRTEVPYRIYPGCQRGKNPL